MRKRNNDMSLFNLGSEFRVFPDRCATSSVDATFIVGHALFKQPKKCSIINAKLSKDAAKRFKQWCDESTLFAPDSIPYNKDGYETVGDVVRKDWDVKSGALPLGAYIVGTKPVHNVILNNSRGIADHNLLRSYVDMFARSKSEHNIVIFDRNAEAFQIYGKQLEQYGYDVNIIDCIGARYDDGRRVYGEDRQCLKYNPLALAVYQALDGDWIKVACTVNNAIEHLICLFPKDSDPFHPTAAYNLILGVVYMLMWNALEDYKKEPYNKDCFNRVNLSTVYDVLQKVSENDFQALNGLGINVSDSVDSLAEVFEETVSSIYEDRYIGDDGKEYDRNQSIRSLLMTHQNLLKATMFYDAALYKSLLFLATECMSSYADLEGVVKGFNETNVFDTKAFITPSEESKVKKKVIFFVYMIHSVPMHRLFRSFVNQITYEGYARKSWSDKAVRGTRFVIDDVTALLDSEKDDSDADGFKTMLLIGASCNHLFTVATPSMGAFKRVFGLESKEDFAYFEKEACFVFKKCIDDESIWYFMGRKSSSILILSDFSYNDLAFMSSSNTVVFCPNNVIVWSKHPLPETHQFNAMMQQ